MGRGHIKLLLIVTISISVIFLGFTIVINKRKTEPQILSLDNFWSNNEYKYDGMEWGITSSNVNEIFSDTLELHYETANAEQWVSKTVFVLDGKEAFPKFSFQNDQMVNVTFEFYLEDDYKEWYNTQVEQLIKIYGAESDIQTNSTDAYDTTAYRWDTDKTSLQFILFVQKDKVRTATLGVLVK